MKISEYLFYQYSVYSLLKSQSRINTFIIIMTTYQTDISNQRGFSDHNHYTVNDFTFSTNFKQTLGFGQQTNDNESYREILAEIKKKDARISFLQEKVKRTEETLESFKSKSNQLQFSRDFYRSKLQEECLRNSSCEDDLTTICSAIQSHIDKINRLIYINNQSTSLQDSNPQQSSDLTQKTIKNLTKLDQQLTKLEMTITSKKNESQKMENLSKSLSTSIELTKIKHQKQKEAIKKQLQELKAKYEYKASESEDYKHQITSIMQHKTFTNNLLVTSQKEKISLFNDIYMIGKSEFKVDFEKMSKSDVSFLCLKLFTKVKESEQTINNMRKHIQKLELDLKGKYQKLLKDVRKSVSKSPSPKISRLRKLQTMPVE